jgi:hypothetical protein
VQLQLLIWPWIEVWQARFQLKAAGKGWTAGGLDETDVAGHGFLALLQHLRIVLLQDLAVLQPLYPKLALFTQPVFQHPDWAPFAQSVHQCELADEPESLLLHWAVPELSSVLYSTHTTLLQQGVKHDKAIQELIATVNALATGQIPLHLSIQGTGLFGTDLTANSASQVSLYSIYMLFNCLYSN